MSVVAFLSRGGSDSAVLTQAGLPGVYDALCCTQSEICFQGGFSKPSL